MPPAAAAPNPAAAKRTKVAAAEAAPAPAALPSAHAHGATGDAQRRCERRRSRSIASGKAPQRSAAT